MSKEKKRAIRILGRVLFVIYMAVLFYLLLVSEGYGRGEFAGQAYRYNLEPFREIRRFWIHREKVGYLASFLNIGGNVIGFMPFGFFLPVMHRRLKHVWLVTLLGFLTSLFAETFQLLFKVGCFDVDDLMLNTAGAAAGYLLFLICDVIRRLKFESELSKLP